MRMRTHEIHPMLVHFPLALLPTAVAADTAAASTGSRALADAGRVLTVAAAASMALTGVAGFAAQGAVRAEGEARDVLTTHRNLNVLGLALTSALAMVRARQRRPSAATLLGGLAGVALMTYSGYLGGKLVYRHGVGVGEGQGFDPARSPRIQSNTLGRAARASLASTGDALRQTVEETRQGRVAPYLHGQEAPGPS